jgi:hypothetical protein
MKGRMKMRPVVTYFAITLDFQNRGLVNDSSKPNPLVDGGVPICYRVVDVICVCCT